MTTTPHGDDLYPVAEVEDGQIVSLRITFELPPRSSCPLLR